MIKPRLFPEDIEKYSSADFWGTKTLLDYYDRNVFNYPNQIAVIDRKYRVSFSQMDMIVRSVATKLYHIGVQKGDVIAIQTPNWAEFIFAHFALLKIGAIALPLTINLRETEITYILKKAEAVGAIYPATYHDFDYHDMFIAIQKKIPGLQFLITIGDRMPGYERLDKDDWLVDKEHAYSNDIFKSFYPNGNDPEVLMTTSGTTSMPKVFVRTHNSFITLGMNFVRDRAMLTNRDIVLGMAPVNQGTGYWIEYISPTLSGSTLVLPEKFEPGLILDMAQKEKATVIVGIPTQTVRLLGYEQFDQFDLKTVRLMMNGGAPFPKEKAIEWEQRVPSSRIMQGYGSSDGTVPVITRYFDPQEIRTGSVGSLVPGAEIRLIDNNGNDVPSGGVGEIIERGPNTANGYVNDPEANALAFDEEGWFHSGDLGQWDDAGNLHIVGRKKDMILRGGQNISPREIEELLYKHPGIKEAAVIGMPDPELGERVCAYIVKSDEYQEVIDVPHLQKFLLNQKIAKYKCPERVEIVETLPTSGGGKIKKADLVEDIASKLKAEGKLG